MRSHRHTHTHTCVHTCKHTHPSPSQAASCSATACLAQQWQVFMLMYKHTHTHTHTRARAHMQAYTPLPTSGGIGLSHGLPGAAVAGVHADMLTHTCVHTCEHTHPSPPQAALCLATACPAQRWQAFMLICKHTHACTHASIHTPPHLRRHRARPQPAWGSSGRRSC